MKLLKTTIDCFNSRDGIGRFSGPARYNQLEQVASLCAVQARSLTEFWGILLRKMMWPTPPKRMDEEILSQLSASPKDGLDVLRVIAMQTASIVMIARYLHDQDKTSRKDLEAEWQAVEEGLKKNSAEETLDV